MAEFLPFEWRHHNNAPDFLPDRPHKGAPDQATSKTTLRKLIQHTPNPELRNNLPQDDKTLTKFLYARKFDITDTFLLLQNYYWYKKRNSGIFENFHVDSPDIRQALENALPAVLESKDRKGRCVLILNAMNWDCSYTLVSVYRSILFSLEFLTEDIHNQARGFVIIVDWTEFTFRQSTNLKPSVLKLMIEGLQDCFPARFKGIHFIGQPWYVEAALTVIKQFLKEKIKDRIYVHGNNLSTLHDYVHKDILPAELGGEQPSYNPEKWLKILRGES